MGRYGAALAVLACGTAVGVGLLLTQGRKAAGPATTTAPGSSAAAASTRNSPAASFEMSPITVLPLPGRREVSYRVSVTDVPAQEQPAYTWLLQTQAGGDLACTNSALSSRRQVGPASYAWEEQGSSFVWYQPPGGACRGTVTVTAENLDQHCTATWSGTAGEDPLSGSKATCAFGGYSLAASELPVPQGLLRSYARVDSSLEQLVKRAQQRDLTTSGSLARSLDPILRRQATSFAHFFPPVWGCGFTDLFDRFVVTTGLFEHQAAGGDGPSPAGLADDAAGVRAAAQGVAACERSAARSAGAPHAVVRAVERLSTDTAQLRVQAERGTIGRSSLGTQIQMLANAQNAILRNDFPPVFGISYLKLVDSLAAEESAASSAEAAAGTRATGVEVAALSGAAAPVQAIGHALVQRAARIAARVNAHT